MSLLVNHPLSALAFATAFSLFLYLRAKRIKRFSYDIQQSEVIGEKQLSTSEELKILFNGESVPRVTRALIRFWNSGHETIRGTDIAIADPLRWQMPEGTKILAYNIEKCSRHPIQASIHEGAYEDKPCLLLGFDFLDNGDGAIVSLLHTAPPSSSELKGTIQGIPKGIRNWLVASEIDSALLPRKQKSLARRIFSWLIRYGMFLGITTLGVFSLIAALLPQLVLSYFPSFGEPDTSETLVVGQVNLIYFAGGLIFMLISVLMVLFWWHRPPKRLA